MFGEGKKLYGTRCFLAGNPVEEFIYGVWRSENGTKTGLLVRLLGRAGGRLYEVCCVLQKEILTNRLG